MSFEFFARESWTGFRRSGIMSVVSLVTVTVSLVVLGAFLLAVANMANMASMIGSKMEIAAYVDKNIDDNTASAISMKISAVEDVENVRFISKEEAWGTFKSDYEGRLALGEIISDNPLPNTFIIRVKNPQATAAVAKKIANMQVVDEVRYSGNLADKFQAVLDLVRISGFVVVMLLIIATLLIVINTIKLTVIARQTDIYIMRLVGATNSFIKWPFILEGILIGVIGAAISFMVLKFSYDLVVHEMKSFMPFLPLISSWHKLLWIYISVSAIGIVLGMLGAYISVNSLLKGE